MITIGSNGVREWMRPKPTWEPYVTVNRSYMRRWRWWGWQYRHMTEDEAQAYLKDRFLNDTAPGV